MVEAVALAAVEAADPVEATDPVVREEAMTAADPKTKPASEIEKSLSQCRDPHWRQDNFLRTTQENSKTYEIFRKGTTIPRDRLSQRFAVAIMLQP